MKIANCKLDQVNNLEVAMFSFFYILVKMSKKSISGLFVMHKKIMIG